MSYLATVTALYQVRPGELRKAPERGARGAVTEGLRYVAGRRDLLLPLALTAVVALAGFNFQVTLPLLARTVFHTKAGSFGLLTAGMAVGSLLAALATTLRRGRPGEQTVLGAATAFAALLALSGLAPTFATALLCLSLTGGAMTAFAQSANHRVQLGSDPAYRGRVMAFYTLLLQGPDPRRRPPHRLARRPDRCPRGPVRFRGGVPGRGAGGMGRTRTPIGRR